MLQNIQELHSEKRTTNSSKLMDGQSTAVSGETNKADAFKTVEMLACGSPADECGCVETKQPLFSRSGHDFGFLFPQSLCPGHL